ncbi:MAG: helix-turn-helix domain-containing protein [Candidatus Latescibacteria bacterium]|nr:helix-turn-helix domain-containing protein [Candidatus Latescibacterota bacterium]
MSDARIDQSEHLSIEQAAILLRVTTKTVRNYIDREYLKARKWNGAWRIPKGNILEIYRKKYGKTLEPERLEGLRNESLVQLDRDDYDLLQRRVGKLDAVERTLAERTAEVKAMNERQAQLEASSASGWTEARKYKDDVEDMRESLRTAEKAREEAALLAHWLRKELNRLGEELHSLKEKNKVLENSCEVFKEDLAGKNREIGRLKTELSTLQNKCD